MNRFGARQKGQTVVVVALVLVALLIFVALAIDIGLLHLERRHMQNAADAGALAGARELCLGHSTAEAIAKAREYAIAQNRAQQADITIEGNIVTVVAKKQADLFFGGATGVASRLVAAEAKAACGRVTEGCGLWPVAFFRGAFNRLRQAGCGRTFYVWDDDKTFYCQCPPGDPGCIAYDCDLNDDGIDDIIQGGDRGWLDLSGAAYPYTGECLQPGCGASEIACLILNNSGLRLSLPVCVSGDSGVKAGVKDEVNARKGDTVAIPLYDSVGCRDPRGNCPGGLGYYVTSIGCITVVGWEQSLRIEPQPTPTPTATPTPKPGSTPMPTPTPTKPGGGGGGGGGGGPQVIIGKAIAVRLNCDQSCMSFCGSTDGSPPNPWDMKAVSLIK
jgi:hypothetical protein